MQQTNTLAQPATISTTLDSWNHERSLDQLQQFVQGRLANNSEDIEVTF